MKPPPSRSRWTRRLTFAGGLLSLSVLASCDRREAAAPQAGPPAEVQALLDAKHELSADVLALSEANFDSEALRSSTPVLVDFHADWCVPCKMQAPVVSELAAEYKGRVKVAGVNIDDSAKLCREYGINAIPCLILFKDGKPGPRFVGLQTKATLVSALTRAIGSNAATQPTESAAP
ncbi:MAG: thioredoxin [Planctomycetota bacterium]|nr:thioredoxin [Planctomycetota bacterium]